MEYEHCGSHAHYLPENGQAWPELVADAHRILGTVDPR
jgi:hypothetical protein